MSTSRKRQLCKKGFGMEETFIQPGRLKAILEGIRKGAGVDAGAPSKGKHPRLDSPARNTRSVARKLLIREASPHFEETHIGDPVDRNEAFQSPITSPTAPCRRSLRRQGVEATPPDLPSEAAHDLGESVDRNEAFQSPITSPTAPSKRSRRRQGVEATLPNTSEGEPEPEETPIWRSRRLQGVEASIAPEREETTTESIGKYKNPNAKRGKTKMKGIALDDNGPIPVSFNAMGQPIGRGSVSLSSFLGPLVREIVPVTLLDWRKLQPRMKEVLWKAIRVCLS